MEAGPSPGILVISWLPVTIDAEGSSNGVRVTGYAVYADGQKVLAVQGAGAVAGGSTKYQTLRHGKLDPGRCLEEAVTVLGPERSDIREGTLLELCGAHCRRHLSVFWRCSWSRTLQQQNSLLCSAQALA